MKLLAPFFILFCCSNVISQGTASSSPPDTPPQTTSGAVYRVGGGVKPPRVVSSPSPDYPKEARKGHEAGPIDLRLVVGIDGQAHDIKVQRGITPELDLAAEQAVEKWKFKPATKDGRPVAVLINVHFDFQPIGTRFPPNSHTAGLKAVHISDII